MMLAKGTPMHFGFDVWGTRLGIEKQLSAATDALANQGLSVGFSTSGGGSYLPAKAAVGANVRLLKAMEPDDAKSIVANSIVSRFFSPSAIAWDTVQNARAAASHTAEGTYKDVKTAAKEAALTVKDTAKGFGFGLGLIGGIVALGAGIAVAIWLLIKVR